MALRWDIVLMMFCLALMIGCMAKEPTPQKPPVTTQVQISPIPTPPVTTPQENVVLEGNRVVPKNEQKSWELECLAGHRYRVSVISDGAPVDLVILDSYNYAKKFSPAVASRSGEPWDAYIALRTKVTTDMVEFKAPTSGTLRIAVENAEVIPNGAVTTRDVSVTIRVVAID